MRPKTTYLWLCVLGTILPYSQFVPFVVQNGLDVRLFFEQLFSNRVSAFFGMDVLVSSVVLCALVVVEGRRAGVRHRWAPVLAALTVGVSLGLPRFSTSERLRSNRTARAPPRRRSTNRDVARHSSPEDPARWPPPARLILRFAAA